MISPQIKFKKKWSDNKGVSEIIGTILMLAITVVLFSSIMVFVTNMPTPIARPTADFLSNLDISTDPPTLTLTHNGGEALNDYETVILVIIDGTVRTRYFDTGTSTSKWSIGEPWSFTGFHNFGSNTSLEAMIVDMHSNSQIWDGKISSGTGDNAPVILQRWTDGNPDTLTVDPVVPTDRNPAFALNVRVTDIDGFSNDLLTIENGMLYTGPSTTEGVWLEIPWASSIAPPPVTSPMARTSSSGGIWTFNFPTFSNASLYDGKPAFIHAKHHGGTIDVIQSFIFSIDQPDITNDNTVNNYTTNYNGTNPTGFTGLPDWLKYFNGGQGWILLPEAKNKAGALTDLPDYNNPRLNCTFKQGDKLWLFIGSLSLSNINEKNQISIISRATGVTQSGSSLNPTFIFTSSPQSGNAYIYQAKLISSQLDPGAYDLKILLSSVVPEGSEPNQFTQTIPLFLNSTTGYVFMPTINVYGNSARTSLLGDILANPIDISIFSKAIIWVEISVLNAPSAAPPTPTQVSLTDVTITDMGGRLNQYGNPPSTVAGISQVGADPTKSTYYFSIDIRLRNGEAWSKGLASYSLSVGQLYDQNEGVYSISLPIWINSPLNVKTYVVATDGFGWGKSGPSSSTAHYDYLFQVNNNKFFTTKILDGIDETSGGGATVGTIIMYKVLYFDVDEDGDRDVLAAVKFGDNYGLLLYINHMNEYGTWETRSVLPYTDTDTDGEILSMAYGDVDGDGTNDWIVANAKGNVFLYRNIFPTSAGVVPVFTLKAYFTEMKLRDIDGDGKADLIAMGNPAMTGFAPADIKKAQRGGSESRLTAINASTLLSVNNPTTYLWKSEKIYMQNFAVGDIDHNGSTDIAASSVDSLTAPTAGAGVIWYDQAPTQGYAYTAADDTTHSTYLTSGTHINLGNTSASYDPTLSGDLNYVELTEQKDASLSYTLTYMWKVTPTSSIGINRNLMLRISAITSATTERFNFYYSTEATPVHWTFLYSIPRTGSLPDVKLPTDTTGSIWVKVTDNWTAGDTSIQDKITLNTVGCYWVRSVSFGTSHLIYNTTINWGAIDIGDADGTGYLEVAIGKKNDAKMCRWNGASWDIIQISTTVNPTYPIGTYSSAGGTNFIFTDVNGDGRADLVSTELYLTYNCVVVEWINLETSFNRIEVKNLYTTFGNSAMRTIKGIAVEDMYG